MVVLANGDERGRISNLVTVVCALSACGHLGMLQLDEGNPAKVTFVMHILSIGTFSILSETGAVLVSTLTTCDVGCSKVALDISTSPSALHWIAFKVCDAAGNW
ncbi:hypothetical protein NE237_000561 [Protea cynaroides]|uniref:Uncharacterized protein n=1 Tax=Protea cynaroides TaxID=273540 RepID=A0A9Q0KRR0_9MAGN|nr:hypothetical protein NE237_000561 [Protea cynaroides]